MEQKRCYGCMKIKTASGPFCEHCGYDEREPGASHHLRPGTILREKYLVGKVLGQGGFGITYLGWDIDLNIPVAIKEYYPSGVVMRESTTAQTVYVVTGGEDSRYSENRARFLREAQTLARLEDVPEVVQVKNFFSENNTAYIIMGYVKGITLKEHIRNRGGRLSVQECFGLLAPLMKAMDRVHALELVHRDISPDNIMLQSNGRVRLIDFGAAHESSEADGRSTQAVLKHGFAPIEQYQGKGKLGAWTDVYAMCATIYYCLTGKQPPHATDRMMGEDAFNWENIPGLTAHQVATLKRGVEIHHSSRIQSMGELYRGLFRGTEQTVLPQSDGYPHTANQGSQVQLVELSAKEQRQAARGAAPKKKKKPIIGILAAVLCIAAIGITVAVMSLSGGGSLSAAGAEDGEGALSAAKRIEVDYELTNLELDGKTNGKSGTDYAATLIAPDGYALPEEISVQVDGSKLSAKKYTYDPESGEITIPADQVTGDIIIAAAAQTVRVETQPQPQPQDQSDELVGKWVGVLDMSLMFNEIMAEEDPMMGEHFVFTGISFQITMEFSEDGICKLYVDDESLEVLGQRLRDQLYTNTYSYIAAMLEEEGMDMTVEELLASEGYTLESFIEENMDVEGLTSSFTGISETGKFIAEDGILYMSDSLTGSPKKVDGNPFTLQGNRLTIQGTGSGDDIEQYMYPMILIRVS